MRFSTYINNQKCVDWGLNANQGALFDLLNQASSWAKPIYEDNEVFYWVSRNEVIAQLPLFYSKSDTVYRHFKDLAKKGLIVYIKKGSKDLIRLTEKGKEWNEFYPSNSDSNPNNSEIVPNNTPKLGNKSEKTRIQIRKISEIDPTNNITNNNIINDKNPPLPPKGKKSSCQKFNPETVELPDFVDRDSWIDYCQMRKAKNAPIKTKRTVELCLKDLEKHSDGNFNNAVAVLQQSVARSWTGLFAVKDDFKHSKPNNEIDFDDDSDFIGTELNLSPETIERLNRQQAGANDENL
ncbi:Uncharacterised protein [Phocoenobacter uteri]|uniref:Phage protein n=1 Tax=Phocoenobacter uteri TaxID=146806 RepID=A0A379C9B9_9PAST|nr:hypothetical protein [Phocoenobacter uteri]SUB58982.1 Uncharacterised protein [Phocoenobacter uteri]